jgi:hypothetical protein
VSGYDPNPSTRETGSQYGAKNYNNQLLKSVKVRQAHRSASMIRPTIAAGGDDLQFCEQTAEQETATAIRDTSGDER